MAISVEFRSPRAKNSAGQVDAISQGAAVSACEKSSEWTMSLLLLGGSNWIWSVVRKDRAFPEKDMGVSENVVYP